MLLCMILVGITQWLPILVELNDKFELDLLRLDSLKDMLF